MAHIDILDYIMTLLMKCFSIVLMLLLDILPKIKKQGVFLQNFLTLPIIMCFYFNGPNTVTTFA